MIDEMPAANELIASVRDFLTNEIAPQLEGSDLGYKLRVANNVLAIVERELQQGAEVAAEEQQALRQVAAEGANLNQLREHLAAQIHAGKLDTQLESVAEALLGSAARRLSIDNPRYSTLQELT